MGALSGTVFVLAVSLVAGCGRQPAEHGPSASEAPPAAAPSTAPSQPEGADEGLITARSRLPEALAEARRWRPDAELTGVTTSMAEGPAHSFWFYDVQSPSAGACNRIRAMANGDVATVGSGDECLLMTPVDEGFVDSPAAFQAALDAGFEPGESVQLGLQFQSDEALAAPRECWRISSDLDSDDATGLTRAWCVDPASGVFVVRLSGRGRQQPLPSAAE
jgi:hypothetical protein